MRALHATALSLLLVAVLACGGDAPTTAEKPSSPPGAEPERKAEPAPRRTLPDADPAPPAALALDQLERLDLMGGLTTGEVSIAANDERIQQSIALVGDGNVETMAVSNSINPAELTITLRRPIRLRAARVYLAASSYEWVVEPVPGEGRLMAVAKPERTWSQIDLPEAVETSVVRLELLRLERDDYVHVNEIELYQEPAP